MRQLLSYIEFIYSSIIDLPVYITDKIDNYKYVTYSNYNLTYYNQTYIIIDQYLFFVCLLFAFDEQRTIYLIKCMENYIFNDR